MGQQAYEAAIINPDSLVDIVDPQTDAEAETYAAAHRAWLAVTGEPDTAEYPARNEAAELCGDDWDTKDQIEARKRLPRLATLYLDED